MRDKNVKRLSGLHAVIFRLTGGRIGRRLVDNDMLLLTTRGAKTGKPHTVPLLYIRDGGRFVVVASYGGRPDHPQWFKNLKVNSDVTIQVGDSKIPAQAATLDHSDRDRLWPEVLAAYDGYRVYQGRTDRTIPLVSVEPTMTGGRA